MNLKEIRTAMFAQADWSPGQSPEAISRVDGFVNRAYKQLMLEAPFLFFESEVHLATEPDVASKSDSDKVKITSTNNTLPSAGRDPWTWETDFTTTVAAANTATYNSWDIDRSWDGRLIEITLDDGTKVTAQIRTIWKDTTADKWKFTLVEPWAFEVNGYGPFKYRIYTKDYAFPDDLIEFKSAHLRNNSNNYNIDVLGQQEAEDRQLVAPRSELASGIPRVMFRRRHLNLMNPTSAPKALRTVLTTATGDSFTHPWQGPEPPGEFEYIVTYTWGKRDIQFKLPGLAHWRGYSERWQNYEGGSVPAGRQESFASEPPATTAVFDAAANRYREPLYESAPSPSSGSVKSPKVAAETWEGSMYPAIRLALPNIEYAMGFLSKQGSTYERQSDHQSGIHVRIYRKRLSAEFESYESLPYRIDGLDENSVLETAATFYLLAEFRIDGTNAAVFYDNGEVIPDRSRRLRDIHGYQTFQFYPRPDKRYTVDVRCIRRPDDLSDDTDTPLVHAEATNVLVQRAMAHLYESMGNFQASQLCEIRYNQELKTLTKRYGDLRPSGVPVLKRMTRAKSTYRSNRYYRKWYETSS